MIGIVRPQGATQHCLALESTNDKAAGARNSVLDSYCSQVPAEYRLFNKTSNENYQGGTNQYLSFSSESTTAIISNTAHGEIQFLTNDVDPDGTPVQLQLISPHEN